MQAKSVDSLIGFNKLKGSLGSSNFWYIQFVRVGYYFLVLATALFAQVLNPYFINAKVWIPVYTVVVVALIFHFSLISLQQNKSINLNLVAFVSDVVFISMINYFTFLAYPVFIVLYLINITLASFVMGSGPSIFIAGVSCFFYSFSFFSSLTDTQFDYLPYFLNILVFYFTSFISGFLGDQYLFGSKEVIRVKGQFRDLKEFSDIVVKNIGTALITFNKLKQVTFVNESASKLFGNSLKNNENSFVKYISSLEEKNHRFTERKEIDLELDKVKKNLELITTHIPNSSMETKWITLVQDLTEVKGLQKELALKEKLAAVGQLAGGIAHEIRNPLASISGSVEMLNQTIEGLSPDNTKLFNIIIKEIDRLNLLITDFLSFVRPEVRKSDDILVGVFIKEIFDFLSFDKKLVGNTKINMNTLDVKVSCDKGKLKQALLNIITNSLQALEKTKDPKLDCDIKSLGRFVEIAIQDNGPGIDEQTLNHIFEPFYTTKAKGTGLGLAITHRIIEGHDGEIKVRSDVKKGTTFLIKLPIK